MRYADRSPDADAVLRDLASGDPHARARAADLLGDLDPAEDPELVARARAALRPLLREESADLRYTAALSLGELRDGEAVDALVEQMEGDGNPLARQAAVIALGMIGDARAVAPLVKALRGGGPEVRFQAATSLAQVDRTAASGPLRAALADDDPEVRGAAAAALGEVGDPGAAGALAPLLQDGPAIRFEAAVALARLGDRRGTAVLVEALRGDPDHRLLAAEHLFRCPDPELAPVLRRELGRWLAPALPKVWLAAALARLGEAEGRARLVALLGSRRQTVRGLAIQVLGELGEPWAREALTALAASPAGADWRDEIAQALGGPRD